MKDEIRSGSFRGAENWLAGFSGASAKGNCRIPIPLIWIFHHPEQTWRAVFRGARASRVLVAASRRDALPHAHQSRRRTHPAAAIQESSFWRDAKTNTRDECAPRITPRCFTRA